MKKLITLLLIFTLAVSLTACSSEEISIEGSFNLNETEILMSEVAEYEAVTQTVVEKTQVAENEIEVTGADFASLLEDNGFTQSDLTKITLEAGDGYIVEIPQEALESQILLVYSVDGEVLDETSAPLRVVIPSQPAKYWVKNIVSITVE